MEKNSYAIPIAIVVAAGLIAGAIYMNGSKKVVVEPGAQKNEIADTTKPVIRQVEASDHIRGNPNAPIMLVEYSDFECPFCKQFHETMKRITDEYGTSGKVAWVFRQFPLEQLHPNAPKIAEASECVAELGKSVAFWKFADLVFGEKPMNDFTELSRLPEFAEKSGVSKAAYEECMKSGRNKTKVTDSIKEAVAAGGRGTPHTLVLVGDQSATINGAQPYEVVKQMVDNLIAQMEGGNVKAE